MIVFFHAVLDSDRIFLAQVANTGRLATSRGASDHEDRRRARLEPDLEILEPGLDFSHLFPVHYEFVLGDGQLVRIINAIQVKARLSPCPHRSLPRRPLELFKVETPRRIRGLTFPGQGSVQAPIVIVRGTLHDSAPTPHSRHCKSGGRP